MPNSRRKGIMPLSRNSKLWQTAGWKTLKRSTIWFIVLGFVGSASSMLGEGGVTFNGMLISGWKGVWYTTLIMAVAGFAFGCIWLLLFRALSLASKN